MSGPHNDKTGPCYCIDNHDHEIQILHMQEILEVFEEPELITVALIEDGVRSDIDCLEETEGNENVFEYAVQKMIDAAVLLLSQGQMQLDSSKMLSMYSRCC